MNRRELFKMTGAGMVVLLQDNLRVFREKPQDNEAKEQLTRYLNSIREEEDRYREAVASRELFTGFRSHTTAEQATDFDMYFPLYKAAEKTFAIPWLLLWTTHLHETDCSRAQNPEARGYLGAMQRSSYYSDQYTVSAAAGWDFLAILPQRYLKSRGCRTNDYEELLFAGRKMREDANQIKRVSPTLTDEESVLHAQFRYCAREFAVSRIRQYLKVNRELTEIINRDKLHERQILRMR